MTDFTSLLDLASERLGGAVLFANDEFFAQKENLLKASKPVFLEHEYTDRGKWMDGWETRRSRTPTFDFCLVRLGVPGRIRGVVIDTAFFRGNYPDHASIHGCVASPNASAADLLADDNEWFDLLAKSKLEGNSQNHFGIDRPERVTHLRLNIFPDGGVARLRVHGDVLPDFRLLARAGHEIDLAAAENGGKVPACSDMFFGVRHNLIMPGRSVNMGDGWETKRRRGPGYDWALVELCAEGEVHRLEIDTNHFKGNYPDTCMVEGVHAASAEEALASKDWKEVLPRTKLQAHTRHHYADEIVARGPFTHLRLNIYPDGGVSRFRVTGVITRSASSAKRLERLNLLPVSAAEAELRACCGSTAWARQMAASRPFTDIDALLRAAQLTWNGLEQADWLEAFRAHPKIGERKAVSSWASEEQSGMRSASEKLAHDMAEKNRAYEAKFGFIYIVCATGKRAEEMLEDLSLRLHHNADAELHVAAREQEKITAIRLEKMLLS